VMLFTCHEHMWQMFKSLEADCRRLPNRNGESLELIPDEPTVIDEEQPAVEDAVIEEPIIEDAPKPKRRKRRVVVQEVVAPEPVDFYDYPFVERIEHETVRTPVAVESNGASVAEYTVAATETTYEWLSDDEEDRYHDRHFRDHLEAR
jgi:hypothetical protein